MYISLTTSNSANLHNQIFVWTMNKQPNNCYHNLILLNLDCCTDIRDITFFHLSPAPFQTNEKRMEKKGNTKISPVK